eukprot:81149-Chlamydomonas_euryale.AAC.1
MEHGVCEADGNLGDEETPKKCDQLSECKYTVALHHKPARLGRRFAPPPLTRRRGRACWSHETRLQVANAPAAAYVTTGSAADALGLAAKVGSAFWDPRKSHASALAKPIA